MIAKSSSSTKSIAFFAGSFNPFTVGHASLVERALTMFDRVVIGIGINVKKNDIKEIEALEANIVRLYEDNQCVEVATYTGLTVDAARRAGATCLLRGVRSAKDFEYERDLADINRQLSGLETVLLFSLPEHAAISSSIIRELQLFGKDVSKYLP